MAVALRAGNPLSVASTRTCTPSLVLRSVWGWWAAGVGGGGRGAVYGSGEENDSEGGEGEGADG